MIAVSSDEGALEAPQFRMTTSAQEVEFSIFGRTLTDEEVVAELADCQVATPSSSSAGIIAAYVDKATYEETVGASAAYEEKTVNIPVEVMATYTTTETTGFENLVSGMDDSTVLLPSDAMAKHKELKEGNLEGFKLKKVLKNQDEEAKMRIKYIEGQMNELKKQDLDSEIAKRLEDIRSQKMTRQKFARKRKQHLNAKTTVVKTPGSPPSKANVAPTTIATTKRENCSSLPRANGEGNKTREDHGHRKGKGCRDGCRSARYNNNL